MLISQSHVQVDPGQLFPYAQSYERSMPAAALAELNWVRAVQGPSTSDLYAGSGRLFLPLPGTGVFWRTARETAFLTPGSGDNANTVAERDPASRGNLSR